MNKFSWLLAATFLALPAQATVVKSLSLGQMTSEADVIVQARVLDRSSAWNAEKTRIYTVTRIQVSETLKGPAESELQIRQIGGTVDGLSQKVVGNATLKVGEEVILFLDRDEAKPFHYVVGMAQGKYAIDRSQTTPRVVRTLHGLALADVADGKVKLKGHAKATLAPSVADFKNRIRGALKVTPPAK